MTDWLWPPTTLNQTFCDHCGESAWLHLRFDPLLGMWDMAPGIQPCIVPGWEVML